MPEQTSTTGALDALTTVLDAADVAPEVFELQPDYRVMLLAVDGIEPGPSDEASKALLDAAEVAAVQALAKWPVTEIPHIAAWREAYRTFGAKPQGTRNSLEALMRRVASGLPRVNKITDVYNAISVLHQVPVGGEGLARYRGAPRLIQARWNWRQCRRTSLINDTTTAVFTLDALDPMGDDALITATDALANALSGLGAGVQVARRLIGAR